MSDSARLPPELWSQLVYQTSDILLVIDVEEARVTDANETALDILGEEIVGSSVIGISGFETEASWRDHLPTVAEEKHLGENKLYRTDGESIPVEASVSRTRTDNGELALVVARDISDRKAREDELRRQKQLAEQYFETAGNIMVVLDRDGTVKRINDRGTRLLGYDRSAVEGSNWFELCVPERTEESVKEVFQRFWTDDAIPAQEHTNVIETKQGERRFVKWHNTTLRDQSGEVKGVLSSGIDISEQKTYEQELDAANTVLRTIVENLPMGILVEDVNREILMANEELTRVLELPVSEDDLVGQDCTHALERAKDRFAEPEQFVDGIERRITDNEPVRNETLELTDGRILERDYVPYTLPDGDAHMWIYRDVTERKEQEKKRQRFQYAFESSLSGLAMVDQEGTLTHVNDAFVEMWGFDDRSDVVGRKAVEMWKQPDKAAAVLEQVIDNGGWEGELEASRADGATFYARGAASHLEDGSGDHIGIVASFVDISERRRREQEIQELKDRLELAIDGANLGVWDRDMRTGEVQVNDNWATMLGYDPDEIDPRLEEWEERIHPADVDAVETAFEAHLAGETEFYESERRMRTADGDWNWVRDIGKVIERNEDGDPIRAVGIQIDVDERKKYERELERTRSDLRQIIDLVPDLIFVKARDGEYLLANETTAEFYGLSVEEVEGSKEHEIIPAVGDSEAFRKDDIGVIESGEPREIPEEELTTADGETRILQTTKIPYQTSESDSGAVLGYARDVTSLKEYEQALERQRDDLEVLNQVVRHDIRNDLQLVLAYAETLADHVEEDGRRYVTQVLEAARDAVDITETARDVTEILLQQETDRFPVRLRHVLEHEIEDARSSTDQAVVRVEGTLPDVEVLADDILESVFRNLLTNAITHNDKAVPEVTVSASSTGDLARIRVADNGPGIPDDREARIFQEGETGLESEGTGLGLYLVQTLVDRYGGDVWIEENDPDGSVFVVELLRAT